MGYDVGASGVFGVMIRDFEPVKEIYSQFIEELNELEPRVEEELAELWTPKFIDTFEKEGVKVPNGACLHFTGSEDERPGRTDAPADEWVLGHGMLTRPWDWPEMDESWRKLANWHTWVWGG